MNLRRHARTRRAGDRQFGLSRVPALPNPADDARLMSDTLLSLGFFVVGGGAQLDLDRAGFDNAL